jgi:exosome complex component RRP41
MSGIKSDIKLFVDGKRIDGRGLKDMRQVKIVAGVLKRADGSSYVEWGKNKIIAAVYGPRECLPKHFQDPLKARLTYTYMMTPFSVDERKRPGPDRRSIEISKVSREAFEKIIFLEYFPNTEIDIYVNVLQADAGTRCAALTAASVALADAGIPMRDLVVACTAGKLEKEVIALDLCKEEDMYGMGDLPVAISPKTQEIHLMQLDGKMTKKELDEAIELAIEGALKVHKLQKEALKKKYEINESEVE